VALKADGSAFGEQVIEAKTPNAMLGVESEDTRVDNRCAAFRFRLNHFALRFFLQGFWLTLVSHYSAIKDERMKHGGKVDTAELDEWLEQLEETGQA
jgi:hypothetical protein